MAGISLGSSLFSSTGLSTGLGLSRGFGLFFGGFTIPAALDLNFATGVLDPRVTFTRASTATYYDSAGKLAYAGSGSPRFTYNPLTLAAQGLMIEESRTNLILYSSDYSNAAWTKRGGTAVLAAQTTAPDGTLTGFSMYDSAASSGTYIRQTPVLADNTVYTSSIYVKKQALSSIRLICYAKSSTSDTASTTINFDTGVATTATTGTVSGTGGGAVDVGNGWWRIWVSLNSSTGAVAIPFQLGSLNNPTGDGTSSVYVWGAQLEAGTFQTSYIPTTTTSAARSADSASMSGTNFSDWYNQSAGTFFCDFAEPGYAASHQLFYATGGSDRINIGINSSLIADAQIVVLGSDTFTGNSPAVSVGNHKIALAYTTNNAGLSMDGSAVTNDNSVVVPTALTNLQIGATSTPSGFINSTIKRFTYYNTRLTNVQIRQITV